MRSICALVITSIVTAHPAYADDGPAERAPSRVPDGEATERAGNGGDLEAARGDARARPAIADARTPADAVDEPDDTAEPAHSPDDADAPAPPTADDAMRAEVTGAEPAAAAGTTTTEADDATLIARPRPRISGWRRAGAIALAVGPGIVMRGIGSWAAGEGPTGFKLLLASGAGLVLGGIGGSIIGATGANPYTTALVPFVVAGGGAFVTSWIADVWVAAGGDKVDTQPLGVTPWALEAGGTWQYDAYRDRKFARVAGRVELGRIGLGGAALLDTGGDAWLAFYDARVRLLGAPPSGGTIADGSRLYARVGGRVQRDDIDRVTQVVGELEVQGRIDLRHADPLLRATFVEAGLGIGGLRATYADSEHDVDSLMLARFGWGIYLPRGELVLAYDHRRDGIVGGIPAFRASGFIGSVSASLDYRVWGPWMVRGGVQIGNAVVSTVAIGYLGGTR